MPAIEIQVQGLSALVQRLGKTLAYETLRAPLQRGIDRLRQRMQDYPPERPGQVYVRTGNLGRSWAQPTLDSSQLTARLSSHISYGPFVQGDKTQARIHRGRWTTDAQAIEQEAPAIQSDFEKAVQAALDKP